MGFIQQGLGISRNYPQNVAFASAAPHFIWDHKNYEQLDILVKEYPAWVWWPTPVVPVLGRLRQEKQLSLVVSSRSEQHM